MFQISIVNFINRKEGERERVFIRQQTEHFGYGSSGSRVSLCEKHTATQCVESKGNLNKLPKEILLYRRGGWRMVRLMCAFFCFTVPGVVVYTDTCVLRASAEKIFRYNKNFDFIDRQCLVMILQRLFWQLYYGQSYCFQSAVG